MRVLILLVLFTVLGQTAPSIYANNPIVSTTNIEVNNYIMTTGVSGYVPVIIMAAAEMKSKEGEKFGKFEVVIYGEAVKQFADKDAGQKLVDMAKASGATIILCDLALKNFGISKESLPEGLEFVENAFTYNLEMLKKGYYVLGV
ncbi:MAG: DsrE family protein [Lutibacter sp.]|nr:DsrE family protein [Lutibacter sp.]